MVRQENPKVVISPVIAEAVNTVSFVENLIILAYMATSGGHFSRPLGMGGLRSYSG